MKTLQDYHKEVHDIRTLIAKGKPLPEYARHFITHHGLYLPEEIIKPTFDEVDKAHPIEKLFEKPAFYWYAHEYLESPRFANFWLISSVRNIPLRQEYHISLDESLCQNTEHPIFKHLDKYTIETLWCSFSTVKIDAALKPVHIEKYASSNTLHVLQHILREYPSIAYDLLMYVIQEAQTAPVKTTMIELLSLVATGGWNKEDKERWCSTLLTAMQNTPNMDVVQIAAKQIPSLLPKGHPEWISFMDELLYRKAMIAHHAHIPLNYPNLFKVINVPAVTTLIKRVQTPEWAILSDENKRIMAVTLGLRKVKVHKLAFHEDPAFQAWYQEGQAMGDMGITEVHYRQQHAHISDEVPLHF